MMIQFQDFQKFLILFGGDVEKVLRKGFFYNEEITHFLFFFHWQRFNCTFIPIHFVNARKMKKFFRQISLVSGEYLSQTLFSIFKTFHSLMFLQIHTIFSYSSY